MERYVEINRKTNETDIKAKLSLDKVNNININTGIGFFDHMLKSFAFHGGFTLELSCIGDLQVDGHHTVEDIGIVLGQCFKKAAGNKLGIKRFGTATIPMDEALGWCSIDFSGRAFLVYECEFKNEKIGDFETCLFEEFLRSFAFNAGITLHIKSLYGTNEHHKIEACFKALAYALDEALTIKGNHIASTKGIL